MFLSCHVRSYHVTLSEFVKIVLINILAILMISGKLATLSFLKLNVFWNKGHDVIILSSDLNYIVDVVMWLMFGKCSISMREVIITSIL